MADASFLVLVAIYALVAIKVDQWSTISRLGFKSYTPFFFLRNPRAYHVTRIVLFVAAVMTLLFTTAIRWYVGGIVLAVAWLGAFWIGRKLAFNTYRQIHREMIAYEEALKVADPSEYAQIIAGENPIERRAELEQAASRTDRELLELIELSIKWEL